jgi:divalent metal cation (Fe/Co/Zn/Cd) transporter
MKIRRVREIHNINVLHVDGRTEVSLHLKLPGDATLEDAHRTASEVEQAIVAAVPAVDAVRTHLEPLAEETEGRTPGRAEIAADAQEVTRIVVERTGEPPQELRFLESDDGLLLFLTLRLDPSASLAEAHRRASEIEERIRSELPSVADVIVHTEP